MCKANDFDRMIRIMENYYNNELREKQAKQERLYATQTHVNNIFKQLVLSKPDSRFLGSFHREPPIRDDIDYISFLVLHINGNDYMCWFYENNCRLCFSDKTKPNTVYVRHFIAPTEDCVSEFSIYANGINLMEWNLLQQERFNCTKIN